VNDRQSTSKPFEEATGDELKTIANDLVGNSRAGVDIDLLSRQELVENLELRGEICRYLGEYEDAKDDYVESLGLLKQVDGGDGIRARLCAGLAVLFELLGQPQNAKSYYKGAIDLFEGYDPPSALDIADLNNNLGFIYAAEGKTEKAESCLRRALDLTHQSLGPDHEQTALLFNNLGEFYFKVEDDELAREMHEKALAARIKNFGEVHGETGQSYGNLALILIRTGNIKDGLQHFEMALEGFEKDLDAFGYDYEIVAANYRDVLESLGYDRAISVLDKRLTKHGFAWPQPA
jgi:tetratricopeptide (TPR) repeat protein